MNYFLTNYTSTTFLDQLKENLRTCSAFYFSVSFIKKAGLVLLARDIEAALARGVKGRIITSTYQNFTDIESLRTFLNWQRKYAEFECHLDYDSFVDPKDYSTLGYHSKGYLFEFSDHVELAVGSSNITRYALLKNIEWDLLVSETNPEVYKAALAEFSDKWDKTHKLDSEITNLYSNKLNFAVDRWDMDQDYSASPVKPNYMQKKALKELNRFRAMGTGRALVVAAAGSGKTYLAAFDALNFDPKRLLYIVHEESILRKSLETFSNVFGASREYGVYAGGEKELEKDFLFVTNISMAKNLELFAKDEFDYIVIDECHHAAAETYKAIINYFEPEFLVGLTATPERMDNQDVFELFDDNVPYELRLRDAIINELVVPFHYYGIRDQLVDYGLTGKDERKLIAQISTEEHCEYIAAQIEKRRVPGQKLKALAFCRSIAHARMMAETMGAQYHTAYLTGRNNVGERIRAYNDLQSDKENSLEILFTVDILNEGVDIPGVNMVLFLRPTESSTIFIQQLGRGLRKYDNKDFVTVLDFIGNSYKRSTQIAFALGSLAKNFVLEKKLMKSMVQDNFAALGLSDFGVEITFDDLSKEEIINQIDCENFNALKYIKQDYFNFKQYIGSETYPRHVDYINSDCAPDLQRFFSVKTDGKKSASYYGFLQGIGEENIPIFSQEEQELIKNISSYLPLVRKHEYLILQGILDDIHEKDKLAALLSGSISGFEKPQFDHAVRYLIKNNILIENGEELHFPIAVRGTLREYLSDCVLYGLTKYLADFGDTSGFKLWHTYRMDQVQLLRCIDPGYTALGTYYDADGNVFMFVALKKDLDDDSRLNYNDKYLDESTFQWESRNNLPTGEKAQLLSAKQAFVFVRKVESENGIAQPFIFVGTGKMQKTGEVAERKSLLFTIHMNESLPDYLQYDFGLTK